MHLTEDEAKTRWCPFARQVHQGDFELPPHNRSKFGWECCVASGCMQWRKAETAEFKMNAEAEFRKSGRRLESTTGFCGLAGSPVR